MAAVGESLQSTTGQWGEFRGERDATRPVMRAVFSHVQAAAGGAMRFRVPKIPVAPAIRVEVRSWIDSVIYDSSPDSAIRVSPRFSVTSRTGMTLPMILASMATPLIGVGSR